MTGVTVTVVASVAAGCLIVALVASWVDWLLDDDPFVGDDDRWVEPD